MNDNSSESLHPLRATMTVPRRPEAVAQFRKLALSKGTICQYDDVLDKPIHSEGRSWHRVSANRNSIIRHPDVRRILMDMKTRIEAMRILAYYTAGNLDRARHHPNACVRSRSQAFVNLLTQVLKGWCIENAHGINDTGTQVHGGVRVIEELGACQHMRDARITAI